MYARARRSGRLLTTHGCKTKRSLNRIEQPIKIRRLVVIKLGSTVARLDMLRPIGCFTIIAVGLAQAQSVWTQRQPSSSPLARDTHCMAFEPASQRVVLFGGYNLGTGSQLADTWEWDASNWVLMPTGSAPPARETFAMCADGSGGVLLFGGSSFGSGLFNDTWRYTQGAWTLLHASQGPSPRRYMSMVMTAQGPMLFGGWNGAASLDDTWVWNGLTWGAVSSQQRPSPRRIYSMSYDVQRGVAVLFGGVDNGASPNLGDTWEWSGAWLPKANGGPPARFGGAMAYLAPFGCVLFGGLASSGLLNDSWTWDGASWTQLPSTVTPPVRQAHALINTQANSITLFGGRGQVSSLADTWTLSAGSLATFSAFGTGCAGSVGVPSLTPPMGERPRLATTSHLRLSGIPVGPVVAVFVIGFSNSHNSGPLGSYPLPRDLAPLGLPGCIQFVSDDFTNFALSLAGQVDWSLSVPNDPGLAGVSLHVQAIAPDSVAVAAVSNAVTATVGY